MPGALTTSGSVNVTGTTAVKFEFESGASIITLTNKSGDNIWINLNGPAVIGEGIEIPGGSGNTPGGAGAGLASFARGPLSMISEGASSDVAFLRVLNKDT